MKKKKDVSSQLTRDEFQEQLKRKNLIVEKLKREARIEASLEKVRAIALSMKAPEDMPEVCKIISLLLQSLGLTEIRNVQTAIFYESRGSYMNYEYYARHDKTVITETIYTNHEVAREFAAKMIKGKGEFYVTHIKGKKVGEWLAYQKTTNVFIDHCLETANSLNYYWYSLGPVALGISTYAPLGKQEIKLFKRFLNVFELAYTRYLDIEQAATQAKEALVELALERVRARTMAMQKSEELSETVYILFQQFKELGESPDQATIGIINEKEWAIEYWVTMYGNQTNRMYKFPIDEPNVTNKIYHAWKEQKKSLVIELSGKELYDFSTFRESMGGAAYNDKEKKRVINVAFFSRGLINVQSNELRSAESIRLLERFAGVFEQTYTRFLDLQKAEAQSKESQIELGLERVRARAMAMQSSNELSDLVDTVFKELTKLDFALNWCIINVIDESSLSNTVWAANPDIDKVPESYHMKFEDYPFHDAMMKGYKERATKYIYVIEGLEKKVYDEYLFNETEFRKVPEEAKAASRAMEKYVVSFSFSNFGGLQTVGDKPLSDINLDILERFGKVFDLTYTRFNDLLKAEAQARESQIQLALERARTQSMIMQHSTELDDTLRVFHDQVLQLGIPSAFSFLWLPDEEKDRHIFWAAWAENNSFKSKAIDYPLDRNEPATAQCLIDWKSNQRVVAYHVPPPSVKDYFDAWSELIAGVDELRPENFSDGLYYVEAFMKYGCFGVMVKNTLPKDDRKILSRFAVEFERAYTRFLELQKAEAQTRESQIQLALERVRARTMAMHQSNELAEAALLLFQQLHELGLSFSRTGFYIWQKDTDLVEGWVSNGALDGILPSLLLPFKEDKGHRGIYEASLKGELSYEQELSGEGLEKHYQWLMSQPTAPKTIRKLNESEYELMQTQYKYAAIFKGGYLLVIALKPQPNAKDLLERFAKVFEQTYTRFLDLQKAETQARESQIQLALERVRARTMAMQNSHELPEAANLLFQQAQSLGMPAWSAGYCIWNEDKSVITLWMSSEGVLQPPFIAPTTEDELFIQMRQGFEEGKALHVVEMGGEKLVKHYQYMRTLPVVGKILDSIINAGHPLPNFQIMHHAYFSTGFLLFITYEPVPDAHDIFKRFAKVFEQTYTRFLDLQKAEAQAREAQIEAALERVRSRSMGMQKSEELHDVIKIVYQQLRHLKINLDHAGFVVDYTPGGDWHFWIADEQDIPSKITHSYFESVWANQFNEAKAKGTDFFATHLNFEEKNKFYNELLSHINGLPEASRDFYLSCPGLAATTVLFDNVSLYIENFEGITYTDEENKVIMRFGKVFQQTYTRFLDLQKAEAQARESQIELSLERLRAKTMAMHNSVDVGETAAVMVEELKKLGIETIRCGIGIMHEPDDMEVWTIFTDENNKTDIIIGWLDMNMHPLLHNAFESWRKKNESYYYDLKDDELLSYFNAINNYPGYPIRYDTASLPRQIHHNEFYFPEGILFAFSLRQISEEQGKIFKRFAGVFGQTYRRYLDLQKAESQAREAQIEAALERVRSRTMAMQNSDELAELVATVFTELNRLEFALTSCIIWINNPELLTAEMWVSSTELNKPPEPYYIKPFRHPYFKSVIDAFKEKNKKWVYEMSGEEKKVFQEQFFNEVGSFPTLIKKALESPESVVYSASFYNFGALEIVGSEYLTDEKFEILHRLGKVFDMSYTRFNDLKQAEAQAKEARIEAALERVRSRTLAMQKSDELAETAAVLFRQLIDLGIAPNRLYIGIINDDTGDIEAWATDEDGGKINSRFTLSSSRNASIKKMYDGWKLQEKSITIDMQGEELTDYIAYLSGEIHVPVTVGHTQQRRVQNIAYFGKGLIGIASPDPQPRETIQLIERFAAVFNLTYTRFNDLKVSEAHALQAEEDLIKLQTEKQRAEDALTELRATQAQLIQSEKMASLGELTAGIAHEIQNPLNFVNNFSEVNAELIDELQQEMDKGDIGEARAIAKDIKENEQKINHHGKRADAIVKGMLQHSRSSTGVKEPTGINALADEYLRLAFHGLRAKDKDFNATIKTDFDEGIGKINIIPQDFGRVLLNLYNNAFYATNEKKKGGGADYEPTVTVTTKKIDSKIELTVKDNGNGVPQKIIDKIFQPFFTTKPTGEGTGLGLSLSYDIVKAHGGELKVVTKEAEGSEFIIQLPSV